MVVISGRGTGDRNVRVQDGMLYQSRLGRESMLVQWTD
jgi:hypothetical protein